MDSFSLPQTHIWSRRLRDYSLFDTRRSAATCGCEAPMVIVLDEISETPQPICVFFAFCGRETVWKADWALHLWRLLGRKTHPHCFIRVLRCESQNRLRRSKPFIQIRSATFFREKNVCFLTSTRKQKHTNRCHPASMIVWCMMPGEISRARLLHHRFGECKYKHVQLEQRTRSDKHNTKGWLFCIEQMCQEYVLTCLPQKRCWKYGAGLRWRFLCVYLRPVLEEKKR